MCIFEDILREVVVSLSKEVGKHLLRWGLRRSFVENIKGAPHRSWVFAAELGDGTLHSHHGIDCFPRNVIQWAKHFSQYFLMLQNEALDQFWYWFFFLSPRGPFIEPFMSVCPPVHPSRNNVSFSSTYIFLIFLLHFASPLQKTYFPSPVMRAPLLLFRSWVAMSVRVW